MQSQRRQDSKNSPENQERRRPYARPEIIYHGKITIRAGSPFGGRIGPQSGPDVVPGS